MAFKLGPFELEHPFILAPMAGISNSPYRRLMREQGSALVVSELVSANGLEFSNAKTQAMLHFEESERPIGLQIFGERPDLLVKACRYIENLKADFIDLNLGCPVPKIVKKGAGSAMCRKPAELRKTLEAMVRSVDIPVTIKIRTGWNQDEINAHEVVQAAFDAGICWVGVHGRTRAQGYSGEADWDLISEIKAKSKVPIIGNGDIKTPQLAVEKFRKSGVDGIYIGRAALRNPFLFQQARDLLLNGSFLEPSIDDYLGFLLKQKEYLVHQTFERLPLIQSRKFLGWYSAGFPYSHEFRKKLFEISDYDQVWQEAFQFFESGLSHRSFDFLNQDFLMGGHG